MPNASRPVLQWWGNKVSLQSRVQASSPNCCTDIPGWVYRPSYSTPETHPVSLACWSSCPSACMAPCPPEASCAHVRSSRVPTGGRGVCAQPAALFLWGDPCVRWDRLSMMRWPWRAALLQRASGSFWQKYVHVVVSSLQIRSSNDLYTKTFLLVTKSALLGPTLQFSRSHFYFSTEPGQTFQLYYCGTAHEQQLLPK